MSLNSRKVVLYNSQVINANDQASQSVNTEHAREAVIFIAVEVVSGTSPTLDFDVQMTYQSDGNWHKDSDVPQIAEPTTPSYETVHKVTNLGASLRLNPTLDGTSPSYTISAWAILKG